MNITVAHHVIDATHSAKLIKMSDEHGDFFRVETYLSEPGKQTIALIANDYRSYAMAKHTYLQLTQAKSHLPQ